MATATSFTFVRGGIEGQITYCTSIGLALFVRREGTANWQSKPISETAANEIVRQVRGGNGLATFDQWNGAESLKQACLKEDRDEAEQLYRGDAFKQMLHSFGLPMPEDE